MIRGLGPSSLCPTSVLGVIAFSRGCDLAVVEGVDFNAQQYKRNRQNRNSGRLEKDTSVSRLEGGRAVL